VQLILVSRVVHKKMQSAKKISLLESAGKRREVPLVLPVFPYPFPSDNLLALTTLLKERIQLATEAKTLVKNERPEEDAEDLPKADKTKYAVELKEVTVRFRSYKERPTSLKESVLKLLKNGKVKHFTTFNALSDVNLKIRKGTIFGIIGSNGAGKSTLLKTISGVLRPAKGSVVVRGKIDSLIQLGAGFDPELNAIENIYLYSSLHGKSSREIESRVDKILEFAELKEFSLTPIKYYSSGMYARLGFSCAIDMDPEVLLVDEVLAVGDERFRNKCKKVFNEFLTSGRTIIMVSHSIPALGKMADSIAVLSKGKIIFQGDPQEAIEIYRAQNYETALDGKRL